MGVVLAVVSQGLRPGVGTAQPLVSWDGHCLEPASLAGVRQRGDLAMVVAPSPFHGESHPAPFLVPRQCGRRADCTAEGEKLPGWAAQGHDIHTHAAHGRPWSPQRNLLRFSVVRLFHYFLESDGHLPKKQKDDRA